MEAVLKVGGSLAEHPESLRKLCKELSSLAKVHRIVVVPGGGEFADTVRRIDRTYRLSDAVAHKMAILAMDQYGLLLSDITPDAYVCYDIKETENTNGKSPIFLPSKLMFREDPLENSWDVTSDTIAAYIADVLQANKLLLVTDVDGVFTHDPKKGMKTKLIEQVSAMELLDLKERTSVDKMLPKMVLQTKLDCYVVNGRHPERIKQVLENKHAICTRITI
jgi:aspartokinase-like uncharacterized kinase